jgi:hypothetical protein
VYCLHLYRQLYRLAVRDWWQQRGQLKVLQRLYRQQQQQQV